MKFFLLPEIVEKGKTRARLQAPPLLAPRRGNLDYGLRKYFLVKSGILGFGIRNTAQRIWNHTKDWNPESKFYQQRPESSTWNPESSAKNPESKTVLDPLTWGDYSSVSVFSNTVTKKKVTRFLTNSVCQCDGGIVTGKSLGSEVEISKGITQLLGRMRSRKS